MKYSKKIGKAMAADKGAKRPAASYSGAPHTAERPKSGPASSNNERTDKHSRKPKPTRDELVMENARRHRVRHKKNYVLYYILLLVLLLGTGVALSLTVFFNIESIEVANQGGLSKEQIIADSGIKTGDNLFRLSADRAAQAVIENNVSIDDVHIQRILPATLRIELVLSKPAAVVYSGDKYYCLSQGNRIIRISDINEDTGVPLFLGCDFSDEQLGDYVLANSSNKLETLLAVEHAISENQAESLIPCVDLTSLVTLRLYYQDRIEMKFGGIQNLSFELEHALELVDERLAAEDYAVLDATLVSSNSQYYVQPLESTPLPNVLRSEPTATAATETGPVIGYDLPPDQSPPDWEELQPVSGEDASSTADASSPDE